MSKRILLGVLTVVALCLAQSERGNITGSVTDATGARMAGVPITVTNTATNVSTHVTSSSTGEYYAPNLNPGVYRIEISAPGFRRFVLAGVNLTAAATVRANARLQVGEVNQSIEVTAAAVQMQTEDAKVSTAVQNQLVDQLPLVVGGALRSPFDLVSTISDAKGSGNSLSLGGGQAASWSATLDGLSVNTNRSADASETAYLTPSVEAITEFSVDTNGFEAEYGQAGGGVITFASKSGTNEYHGSAYEFLRNDVLDARGFFAKTRSIYKQSDFGVSLGGPVVVPKIYSGKDRTFFFLSYEGFRNRLGSNGSVLSVPTPEMYNGDFSNWVNSKGQQLRIYDPDSTRPNPNGSGSIRDPFANNQIPMSRFSSVASSILPYAQGATPNRGGLVPGTIGYVSNNYISNGGVTEKPTDKGSLKIDQNFGPNHHLSFFQPRRGNLWVV